MQGDTHSVCLGNTLVPITTPKRITIGAYLVLAVARSCDRIAVCHVCKRMGVDEPGADRARVTSEYFLKIRHINVHKTFAFVWSVSRRKTHIRMPVPREPAPPLDPGFLGKWLHNLPPCGDFTSGGEVAAQQFLIPLVYKRVVLQRERRGQIVSVDQINLTTGCIQQDFRGN